MRILVLLALLALAASARADVAMLPLDADAKLEIYGQPVASRIARALQGGGVEVVVVKAGMEVPASAMLVIRGKITGGKGTAVAITIEVSNPLDGTLLERLTTSAPSLTEIDKVAGDLATRLLPVVQTRLAELARREPPRIIGSQAPIVVRLPQVLVGLAVASSAGRDAPALRSALGTAVARTIREASREPRDVDASTLHPKLAATTVTSAHAAGAIALEVLALSITTHREDLAGKPVQVPLARARVRVRVADPTHVMFDRVVVTDTIVGEREMAADALAARVATEVLAILRPHLRRMVTAWP